MIRRQWHECPAATLSAPPDGRYLEPILLV
jgi:hypothetical protein